MWAHKTKTPEIVGLTHGLAQCPTGPPVVSASWVVSLMDSGWLLAAPGAGLVWERAASRVLPCQLGSRARLEPSSGARRTELELEPPSPSTAASHSVGQMGVQ